MLFPHEKSFMIGFSCAEIEKARVKVARLTKSLFISIFLNLDKVLWVLA